jgi:hypothetical protein
MAGRAVNQTSVAEDIAMPQENRDATDNSKFNRYSAVGFTLLFLIFATIVFVFAKTLVFDQPISDESVKQALIAASVGVTVSCLISWMLDLLQIIELRPGWSKLLWTVLVASILSTSALAYKAVFVTPDTLQIACIRPIAMNASPSTNDWIRPITAVTEEGYARGNAFGFILVLKNVKRDRNGTADLLVRYEYTEGSTRAAYLEIGYKGSLKGGGSNSNNKILLDEARKAAPDCAEGTNVTPMIIGSPLQPPDPGPGQHRLDVVVYDNVDQNFARASMVTATLN